jgi:peptidoglycan-N-acetylglucosamine deacetylase
VKRLTLSFDNGPAPGSTERILRAHDERDLPATFFMVGPSGTEARVRAEIGGAHAALRDLLDGELLFRPNGRGVLGPHLLSESAVAYLTASPRMCASRLVNSRTCDR